MNRSLRFNYVPHSNNTDQPAGIINHQHMFYAMLTMSKSFIRKIARLTIISSKLINPCRKENIFLTWDLQNPETKLFPVIIPSGLPLSATTQS